MIAFRGSNNLGEFSNSATTLRQDTCNLRGPCGEVQEFFYERIQAALKALDGKVRSGSKLILTGHSLGETDFIYTDFKFPITRHLIFAIGGAVATLAALFYRRLGFSEVRLITFGSLRVGDPDWRTAFNRAGIQSYQRFVNIGRSSGVIFSGPYDYQDAATDWPPELFNQYVHVGNEVLLDYGNFRGRRSYSKFLHLIEIYGTTMKRRLDGSGLECTAPPPPQPETSILPPPVQTTVMPPPVQTTVMPPPAQTTMMPPPAQTTAPSKPPTTTKKPVPTVMPANSPFPFDLLALVGASNKRQQSAYFSLECVYKSGHDSCGPAPILAGTNWSVANSAGARRPVTVGSKIRLMTEPKGVYCLSVDSYQRNGKYVCHDRRRLRQIPTDASFLLKTRRGEFRLR